jgi:hypothetical protein
MPIGNRARLGMMAFGPKKVFRPADAGRKMTRVLVARKLASFAVVVPFASASARGEPHEVYFPACFVAIAGCQLTSMAFGIWPNTIHAASSTLHELKSPLRVYIPLDTVVCPYSRARQTYFTYQANIKHDRYPTDGTGSQDLRSGSW